MKNLSVECFKVAQSFKQLKYGIQKSFKLCGDISSQMALEYVRKHTLRLAQSLYFLETEFNAVVFVC